MLDAVELASMVNPVFNNNFSIPGQKNRASKERAAARLMVAAVKQHFDLLVSQNFA